MSEQEIDKDLQEFLRTQVGGIDALDILLLLHEESSAEMSPEAVFRRVQTSLAAVSARLEALYCHGLLVNNGSKSSPLYRANLFDPNQAQRIGRILQMYKERPVAIIQALYAPTPGALNQPGASSPGGRD